MVKILSFFLPVNFESYWADKMTVPYKPGFSYFIDGEYVGAVQIARGLVKPR
jgi:hypothetical protein